MEALPIAMLFHMANLPTPALGFHMCHVHYLQIIGHNSQGLFILDAYWSGRCATPPLFVGQVPSGNSNRGAPFDLI